jgi:hypothetical protein
MEPQTIYFQGMPWQKYMSFTTTIHTRLYITFVHDTSMYIHIVYIDTHIHQEFEPKNSWRCNKVLTTKSF